MPGENPIPLKIAPKVVSICEKRNSLSGVVRSKKVKRLKTKFKRFWIKNHNCLTHNMNEFKFLTCHSTQFKAF